MVSIHVPKGYRPNTHPLFHSFLHFDENKFKSNLNGARSTGWCHSVLYKSYTILHYVIASLDNNKLYRLIQSLVVIESLVMKKIPLQSFSKFSHFHFTLLKVTYGNLTHTLLLLSYAIEFT